MKNKFIIIKTTYPNLAEAKNLAEILLKEKLAACIQFMPIESCYFWHGKIINESEILLNIKTKKSLFSQVKKIITKHHSYNIPQILAIDISDTSESYSNWINENL